MRSLVACTRAATLGASENRILVRSRPTRLRWLVRHIRDRVRKWCDQHNKWRARFWAWRTQRLNSQRTRRDWLDSQPARYVPLRVQRTTTVAKWLAGLSGAGVVLAFAFYMQAYLSILSIKDDCVSRRFVADAIWTAAVLVLCTIVAGLFALAAIVGPSACGMRRNWRRRREAKPPLQSGHEFDGLSEGQVRRTWRLQVLSASLLVSYPRHVHRVFRLHRSDQLGQAGGRAKGVARIRAAVRSAGSTEYMSLGVIPPAACHWQAGYAGVGLCLNVNAH